MNCTLARNEWHAHRDGERNALSDAAQLHIADCTACTAWRNDMDHLAAALDDLRDWSAVPPQAATPCSEESSAAKRWSRPWAGGVGIAIAAALTLVCGLLLHPSTALHRTVNITLPTSSAEPAPVANPAPTELTVLADSHDRSYAVSTDSSSSAVQVYWVFQSSDRGGTQ